MSEASKLASIIMKAILTDVCDETLCKPRWNEVTQLVIDRAEEVIDLIATDYPNSPPRIVIDEFGDVCFDWKLYDTDFRLELIVTNDDYKVRCTNWYTDVEREAIFNDIRRIPKFLKLLDD